MTLRWGVTNHPEARRRRPWHSSVRHERQRRRQKTRKSPFWRFSIKFYAVPGVADACIALQDQAKVDVNILFYLLWNATQGRAFNAADVTEIERRIGPWRDIAVVPIRNVRRALKAPPAVMAAAAGGRLPHPDQGGRARGRASPAGGAVRPRAVQPPGPAGPVQGRGGPGQHQLLSGRHRPVPAGAAGHRAFGICKVRVGIAANERVDR